MKTPRFQAVSFLSKKSLLLTATFLYILSVNFSGLWADADYSFRDENYEEIRLPKKPIVRLHKPGSLFAQAPLHKPIITVKARKEGLQLIRVIEFDFPERPEPAGNEKFDRFKAIYLLDKDNLVMGYTALGPTQKHAVITINSVINYVQVFIECSEHGLWMEELSIKL